MTYRMKAVYRDGAFVPETPCELPENTTVDLVVRDATRPPPAVTDPEQRSAILRRITARMGQNAIPKDAPRFTRDELHERR